MHSLPLHICWFGMVAAIVGCSTRAERPSKTQSADADEAAWNAKQSPRAEQNASTLRQKILAETNRSRTHDWAGEYYAGDGLGVNTTLAVAPGSGFVFEWHGCLGLYDRNYGPVVWTNSLIQLSFTFENKRRGFQGIAPEFIPVSSAERRHLVPADDIVGFCNNVNEGREPRMHVQGYYLLRKGDEKKEVAGFPNVPNEYQAYLLTKPIEAAIVAVGPHTTRPGAGEWKFKDTPVTIDAGRVAECASG